MLGRLSVIVWIISTHALREEGNSTKLVICAPIAISTHALREEGDSKSVLCYHGVRISTHALREEGDGGDRKGLYGI